MKRRKTLVRRSENNAVRNVQDAHLNDRELCQFSMESLQIEIRTIAACWYIHCTHRIATRTRMPLIFKPRSNTVVQIALLAGIGGAALAGVIAVVVKWSSFMTETGAPIGQPVSFSHKHHVGALGLDCRYCHATVERAATAGMPSTHTCMTCHSQIWTQAKILEPVRRSLKEGKPIEWNRVYRLPKFVYFNHSIHVEKGVGCASCHGQVDQMPITWKEKNFYMKDCLSCHREPEKFLRPKQEVFNMRWTPPSDQVTPGKILLEKYHIPKQRLTDCVTCHR